MTRKPYDYLKKRHREGLCNVPGCLKPPITRKDGTKGWLCRSHQDAHNTAQRAKRKVDRDK